MYADNEVVAIILAFLHFRKVQYVCTGYQMGRHGPVIFELELAMINVGDECKEDHNPLQDPKLLRRHRHLECISR